MNRLLRGAACLTLLTSAIPALAQSPPVEIRTVGAHVAARGDTPELARQLARVDGERKAWRAASAQLQARPDIRALRLTTAQVDAFTAIIIEAQEAPQPGTPRTANAPLQVAVLARFEPTNVARQMSGLRSDQDAGPGVVAAWAQMQELYDRLGVQTKQRSSATTADATRIANEQQQTLRALTVRHLTARATAAMARTQPATVGGRVPTAEGRERAGRLFEQARALWPDSPDVHSLTGDMLIDAEQPEAAEEWYRKALVGNENSVTAHLKMAEVLRLQGKLDAAILEVREALKVNPKSAAAHTDLGLILRSQGKVDESLAEYREAIRLDPDWTDAHNGLAVALAGQGEMAQAVAEFREIIRIDPDSTIGYYNLATALANLDLDGESAAALREVIRIYPDHYNAHFNLGELFRLEGKFDESAKQFREYVRLAPDTPQNQRNLKRARSYIQQFEN